eukprot:m.39042 g.39042  ORF g.39042 m.39042 type:complete len:168 (-) comp11554_c0_seq2:112-615(-)
MALGREADGEEEVDECGGVSGTMTGEEMVAFLGMIEDQNEGNQKQKLCALFRRAAFVWLSPPLRLRGCHRHCTAERNAHLCACVEVGAALYLCAISRLCVLCAFICMACCRVNYVAAFVRVSISSPMFLCVHSPHAHFLMRSMSSSFTCTCAQGAILQRCAAPVVRG